MSGIQSIVNESRQFQETVKGLSGAISSVQVDWHDEKHAKLAAMVGEIAKQSKGVIVTADKLSSYVKKFDSVAAQN